MDYVHTVNADRIIVRKKNKDIDPPCLLKNTFFDALQYLKQSNVNNFETTPLEKKIQFFFIDQNEYGKKICFSKVHEQSEIYFHSRLETVLPYFMFQKQSKVTFFIPSIDSQHVPVPKRKKPQDSHSSKKLPSSLS
ncbi:hypothetical protein [Peribacillus alkalitolerans]|uniref:hypothetical protein n=1 Tax=Peribacillus alkalitolerans TaxID=1550385 RepID=UPI0013D35721|nr:hypothetical protein [Peribacillus alkalitolerans]